MKEFDSLINVPKIPPEGNFDDFVNDPIEFDVIFLFFFCFVNKFVKTFF